MQGVECGWMALHTVPTVLGLGWWWLYSLFELSACPWETFLPRHVLCCPDVPPPHHMFENRMGKPDLPKTCLIIWKLKLAGKGQSNNQSKGHLCSSLLPEHHTWGGLLLFQHESFSEGAISHFYTSSLERQRRFVLKVAGLMESHGWSVSAHTQDEVATGHSILSYHCVCYAIPFVYSLAFYILLV